MQTLVLGLGNLIHGDDGVGVHVIHRLQEDPRVPAEVGLMDGGTLGLSLIPYISSVDRLLVVDAVDAGCSPGTLIRLEGEAALTLPGKPSVHQLGFADLMIAMTLLGDPPHEVIVIGVQPQSTEWSVELTAPVRDSMDELVAVVIAQLKSWDSRDKNILV